MNRRYNIGRAIRAPVDPLLSQHPANESIRCSVVRLIDDGGFNHGVMEINKAFAMANEKDADLVIVNSNSEPPIARITDYNKFIFNLKQQRKEQDRRNRENQIAIKEIQLRPVTGQHDISIKLKHAREWLDAKHKLRIVMRFKGREQAHPALGMKLMSDFIKDLGDCRIEQESQMLGRSITAIIAPSKA